MILAPKGCLEKKRSLLMTSRVFGMRLVRPVSAGHGLRRPGPARTLQRRAPTDRLNQ
jgi:hypothetical protein